jgi:hypothetical protein
MRNTRKKNTIGILVDIELFDGREASSCPIGISVGAIRATALGRY